MAFANPMEKLKEEATCSVCLEYMTDPVSIDCGHNFCRACITGYCQAKGLGASRPLSCPQCRAAFQKSNVRPNQQLANIVESIKQLRLSPARGAPEELCKKHEERLKLFCEEDGEAICVVCRESLEHRPHTVYPIEEEAPAYKIKLQKSLDLLLEKVCEIESCELKEKAKTQECKDVIKKKRKSIGAEFGKMHQLLAEEEKRLLCKLEEEEKIILQKINENVAKLLQQRSSVDKLILEIREKFQQSANGMLRDIKSILSRCEAELARQAPEACSVVLSGNYSIPDRCLGMRNMLKKYKVTLDSGTAHPELILSENQKRVRRGTKKQPAPFDNPKRFSDSPLVLGAPAFTRGRHYWEVQVGDKTEWGLGLCRELAARKGDVILSPRNSYWALWLQSEGKYQALTSPPTSLHLSVRPKRVGIFLDYEAGEITFYNVTDHDHIYTFTDKFLGPLRPLFCPGSFMGDENAEPLEISWLRGAEEIKCTLL
ncbi:E3 ubiquitin-protein ligase TRIM39-like [Carettochelys insculpta]|uniref:E3 ubiquitin-protein ligase TRIM39-like n=1 Tax=Carettochelys insculpta TaxID=44489 RepID=UPI003EB9D65B